MLTRMKPCHFCGSLFVANGAGLYCRACKGSGTERSHFVYTLKSQPCADCERRYPPEVMHFDHLPGFQKERGISYMMSHGYPLCLIRAEVAKCELVCGNCHAVRTTGRNHERKLAMRREDARVKMASNLTEAAPVVAPSNIADWTELPCPAQPGRSLEFVVVFSKP